MSEQRKDTLRPPSVWSYSTGKRQIRKELAQRPVLITGICGRLGRRLARRLHRERAVIGVDRRDFEGCPKDIAHHKIDIRRKKTQDIFRQERLAAVVHLGIMHDPRVSQMEHHTWNVVGFQRLLEYVAQYDVPKLIVLSSANVYGPRPDNPQFLTEDAPLLGGAAFSEIRDLIEVDMLAQSFFWKRPETDTVILRPAHILGSVRNAPSNYLRLGAIPTLLGFDPMMQVIHQEDVVSAIVQALEAEAMLLKCKSVFLLTTSAQTLFEKLGYAAVDRARVPAAIRATTQFASLCPDSAAVMTKRLA